MRSGWADIPVSTTATRTDPVDASFAAYSPTESVYEMFLRYHHCEYFGSEHSTDGDAGTGNPSSGTMLSGIGRSEMTAYSGLPSPSTSPISVFFPFGYESAIPFGTIPLWTEGFPQEFLITDPEEVPPAGFLHPSNLLPVCGEGQGLKNSHQRSSVKKIAAKSQKSHCNQSGTSGREGGTCGGGFAGNVFVPVAV